MQSNFKVSQMNEKEAKEVCTWKYPGELAIYNFSDWEECIEKGYDISDSAKRENSYFSVYKDGMFFAFLHLVDREEYIEIGVGMKPNECGKHNGYSLMDLAVMKAKELYPNKVIRLTVLTFNKRAIACYESAGFQIINRYYDKKAFFPGERYIMEYKEKE